MDRVVHCPFVPAELELPDVNMGVKFFEGLQNSSAPALIDAANGVTMSRCELREKGEAVAASLVSRGCRGGDVVAIFAHNSLEWVVMLAAALRVDAVTAAINSLLTADEMACQLRLCKPKFVFTESSLLSVALEATGELDNFSEIQLIVHGGECPPGCVSLDTLLNESRCATASPADTGAPARAPPLRCQHDVCLIMFSSGTTGPQKAVQLTHRNVLMQCLVVTHPILSVIYPNAIVFPPLSHIIGFVILTSGLIRGLSVNIVKRFDFKGYLQLLADQKIQKVFVVPPVATLLAKSPLVNDYELNLKCLTSAGAPLGQDIEDQLMKKFPGIVCRQVFGMTETTGLCIAVPKKVEIRKLGSVGVPVFNTIAKIINTQGEAVGPGESGEICVKSPLITPGYLGNEKATDEILREDGWLHTGDVGYYDSEGYFYVTDRVKELIKYNAYQVAPAELESVLLSHPAVADAAVVGVPDPTAGELPFACVVLKASASASSEDILQFVAAKVAPYKKLRGGVKFVKSIPKTSSGKILRREIKRELLQETLRCSAIVNGSAV